MWRDRDDYEEQLADREDEITEAENGMEGKDAMVRRTSANQRQTIFSLN